MHQEIKITSDMWWVGGNDRRKALFENVYPIPNGVSYNSYLVLDEKTVLFDTVDRDVCGVFFENIAHLLGSRPLDYVVVSHMEPDHAATLGELALRYPDIKIVCNTKAKTMIKQFFDFDIESRAVTVAEGGTLVTGRHTFTFVMAPMVHWPEVMVTYDSADRILYSADAFGTFGALSGNIFADKTHIGAAGMAEYRRYYTNIVGKYGTQVQALLKKAAGLDIAMICPLHGPVWRAKLNSIIDKYSKWSSYEPESGAVMIAYASVYGDTQNAAEILAARLAEDGVSDISLYDVSVTHPSYIVSEAFRCSHLVFASTTYNAGIFVNMENLLLDIKAHNLQKRAVSFVENGSWAPTAGNLMKNTVAAMKDMRIVGDTVTLKSSVKEEQRAALVSLADTIAADMPRPDVSKHDSLIEPNAMFKLSYGLFVLTAKDGEKDNGCVINTAAQVTDTPKRITITVNKSNLTHDMILKTGVFNLSVLSVSAPFDIFKRFGFASGRDADKFAGLDGVARGANGLTYITGCANALISGKVVGTKDLGTHTLFIADVTEAKVLSSEPSVTYQYYFDNIKPQPQPAVKAVKGWVCRICGYFYEGEKLPADFICPLCKHGAEDFEPVG